jgi:aspartyl-tRNA synthetase
MNFNIMLRHKVVKLIRRYLEDTHGFVEVPSCELLSAVVFEECLVFTT